MPMKVLKNALILVERPEWQRTGDQGHSFGASKSVQEVGGQNGERGGIGRKDVRRRADHGQGRGRHERLLMYPGGGENSMG